MTDDAPARPFTIELDGEAIESSPARRSPPR